MRIIILTVSDKGKLLHEKLTTKLSDKHYVTVKQFPLTCNYKAKSDGNSCVKKSIWENTLSCIRDGLQDNNYVCVIQDDFVPYDNIENALNNSEEFLNRLCANTIPKRD